MFCTRVASLVCKEECSSPVSLHLLRKGIWACMRCFVGFWNRNNVSLLPYVWYYVVGKSSFKHAREESESKRVYVF